MDRMEFGRKIADKRRNCGESQAKFGEIFNVSQQAVFGWETGSTIPSQEILEELCLLVGVKYEDALKLRKKRIPLEYTTEPSNVGPDRIPITRRVPLISNVQAGAWTEIIDNIQPGDAEEWIYIASNIGPNAFALRVVGNSMELEFREGEFVVVDPDREAASGDYVVAKINHEEATFKQLIKDGGRVYLRPLNSAYPVINVPEDKAFRIIGRVVEKVKRY